MTNLLLILFACFLVAFIVFTGHEDAVMSANHYTNMVCGGYWPDYENVKPVCN